MRTKRYSETVATKITPELLRYLLIKNEETGSRKGEYLRILLEEDFIKWQQEGNELPEDEPLGAKEALASFLGIVAEAAEETPGNGETPGNDE